VADPMTGRVVLVNGAGGELGRAIALELAACGAHVVVADVDGTGAKDTAIQVEDAGGSAEGVELDAGNRHQVASVFKVVFRDYAEKFDGLVNVDVPESTYPSRAFVEGRLALEEADGIADLVDVAAPGAAPGDVSDEIRAEARERGWPLRVSVIDPATTARGSAADIAALVRTAMGCSPG